jgi:O-antigen/teichoic acid export membrane protein
MVIPYVIAGIILYGTWPFFGAGLLIDKKPSIMTGLVIISALANVVLNIVLVPRINIIGAAIATLVAYAFYIFLLIIFSFKRLKFEIDYKHIFLYLSLSFFMYLIVKEIRVGNLWLNLCTKIMVGGTVYSILILIFDKEIKFEFIRILRKHLKKDMN